MSLLRYIINFNELGSDVQDRFEETIRNKVKSIIPDFDLESLERLTQEILKMLPTIQCRDFNSFIEDFLEYELNGTKYIEGKMLDVPPIKGSYSTSFSFEKIVYITEISFNSLGYKKNDTFSILINNEEIVKNCYLKEVGENKYLNTFIKLPLSKELKVVFNNESGNSRQILCDVGYIDGNFQYGIEDIPNDWDIAVKLNWEKGSPADIDLHGYIDDRHHIFYGNRGGDSKGYWLNIDNTSHTKDNNPEILSLKATSRNSLKIYANHFKGEPLKKPITVEVYKFHNNKAILLKRYKRRINNDRDILHGICEVDLKTMDIKDMFIERRN